MCHRCAQPALFSLDQILRRLGCQHDLGVEQRAGDASGDGDQFPLAAEDFDLGGAGKFGEVDGASAADAGDGGFVGGDGGKIGQEFAGMDEESFEGNRILSGFGDLFEGVGVFQDELRDGGSA